MKASNDIQRLLMTWMDHWEHRMVLDLIHDLEIEFSLRGAFIHGKLRSAVHQLTDTDGCSIFSPDDPCTKTGCPVLQNLQEKKHQMPREPTQVGTPGGVFEPYPNLPSCMGPQVLLDMVEVVC